MSALSPYEWRLRRATPFKRTWMRVNPHTYDVEFMEEWSNEAPLRQARIERDIAESSRSEFRPLVVVPQSERARAIREGWDDDEGAWRRWMNDIDNRYLRLSRGYV